MLPKEIIHELQHSKIKELHVNKRTITFEESYRMGNSFPNRAYVIDILHGSNYVNLL
jgi:hypothetical protein